MARSTRPGTSGKTSKSSPAKAARSGKVVGDTANVTKTSPAPRTASSSAVSKGAGSGAKARDVVEAVPNATKRPPTTQTSVRLPVEVHQALSLLHEQGAAPNLTDVLVAGAASQLGLLAQRAGLDAYYLENPELRPAVAEVALALAELDASPVAGHPELVERAAAYLRERRGPDVVADDVLMFAEGMLEARAS